MSSVSDVSDGQSEPQLALISPGLALLARLCAAAGDATTLIRQGIGTLAALSNATSVCAWRETGSGWVLLVLDGSTISPVDLSWDESFGLRPVEVPDEWSATISAAASLTLPAGCRALLGWSVDPTGDGADPETEVAIGVLTTALRRVETDGAYRDLASRLDDVERLGEVGDYEWNPGTGEKCWSDQLYRIFGLVPGAFPPSHEAFLALLHPEDRERVQGVYATALHEGSDYGTVERIVRPDGQVRHLASRGRAVFDDQGRVIGLRGVRADITEQIETTRLLEQQTRAVAEAIARRHRALEFNDTVLQGLTAAALCLQGGDVGEVAVHLERTLATSRRLISEWLHPLDNSPLVPGDLIRSRASSADDAEAATLLDLAQEAVKTDRRVRVLIADDNENVRFLVSKQLEKTGRFQIVALAANGDEAVRSTAEVVPDVVLLDLSMPCMDGLQALPLIRAAAPCSRVIVMSGFSEGEMAERAIAAGAVRYVEKGIRMNLPGVIDDVLAA